KPDQSVVKNRHHILWRGIRRNFLLITTSAQQRHHKEEHAQDRHCRPFIPLPTPVPPSLPRRFGLDRSRLGLETGRFLRRSDQSPAGQSLVKQGRARRYVRTVLRVPTEHFKQ